MDKKFRPSIGFAAFRNNFLQELEQPIFGDVMANKQTSVTRVADRGELLLLLDKVRQLSGNTSTVLKSLPLD